MASVSQILPCFWGGFAGGVYNAIGGVAQDVSAIGVSTFQQGFALGALSGMMHKIIYTRVEQFKESHKEQIGDDALSLLAIHTMAYALMVISWHGARYIANEYLGCEISRRTAFIMTGSQAVLGIPFIGVWTFNSLLAEPEGGDPWELL